MCNLDKYWTKDTKRPKNSTTVSEELRAKNLGTGAKVEYCTHLLHSCMPTPSVQFSSVVQSGLTLCDLMDCSMPGLPVHHQFPEFT